MNASSRVVARITDELLADIRSGTLISGARLPSVRQLARDRAVSPFSAASIYDALVAAGAVEAHAGRGYFVARRRDTRAPDASVQEVLADSVWERRRETQGRPLKIDAGCGWLPHDWLYADGVRAAWRSVARQNSLRLEGYGDAFGLAELRSHLSTLLEARGLLARADQILLTQGASQALDLVIRTCLQPGDAAIVEDPAYPPVFEMLEARGVNILAIPRTDSGPDVDALASLLDRHRARCLFTNTTCHNPTGTTTSPAVAHRLLELAARHDLTVIEDDTFADLAPQPIPTLASLGELRNVVYISSFSKTISPSLRAGFLVAPPALARELARVKVMTSLGSSELLERVVLQILTHGHYRRHVKRLRERLASAHARFARALEAAGGELAFRATGGLFVWARLRSDEPVSKLWRRALAQDVLLAPGELFRPHGRATSYWRFNVAHCDSPEVMALLNAL